MAWKTKPPYNIPVDPAHPLANGLQGCWLFNEGEGLTANDLSGNANTGTLVGAPAWTTGNGGGNALSFNGANAAVACGTSTTIDGAGQGNYSIEAIVKSVDTTNLKAIAGKIQFNPNDWGLHQQSGIFRFRLRGAGAGVVATANAAYASGTWYHLVGTHISLGTGKLYIDGVAQTSTYTATQTPATSSNVFYIGRPVPAGNLFTGIISLVRIWNRALTAAEVLSLYDAPYDMFLDPQVNFLRGTATVTQGNTTATVTHGLGFVPSLVWLQPLSDSGKKWFITNRTSTQFTINLPVAQQADVSFNYGVA